VTDREAQDLIDQSGHGLAHLWKVANVDDGVVTITNSGEWQFDEIASVADIFETSDIDVGDPGCDTCGYGAEIRVRLRAS
jgi:hypothetical protein